MTTSPFEHEWLSGVQPQDLVITILGVYVHPFDRTVWSGGMVQLLGDFGYSNAAARAALMRLTNRGLLGRQREGRLIMNTLTPRTRRLLDDGDRRIYGRGLGPRRAKEWTILWHTIPDERKDDRTRLGHRLRLLGFGGMQDGIWLSPHDRADEVTPLVSELNLERFTAVFTGPMATIGQGKPPVERLWPITQLSSLYRHYVQEFGPLTTADLGAMSDRSIFKARTLLAHAFRGSLSEDPELPDELLDDPAARIEAIQVFNRAYRRLAPASDQYFVQITGPGNTP